MQEMKNIFQKIVRETFDESMCNALEDSFEKLKGQIKNLDDIRFMIEIGNFYDALTLLIKLWVYNFRDKTLFDEFVNCLEILDEKERGVIFFEVISRLDPSGLAGQYKKSYSRKEKSAVSSIVKPNLVLAFCNECNFLNIEPFIASCLKFVPNAKIIFITGDRTETFELVCSRKNIKTLHISSFEESGYHILSERFFIYKQFLEYNYKNYSNILITNVKDVFFQGNPFSVERKSDVILPAEDEIIQASEINSMWIQEFFGQGVYEEIRQNTISCAGTTIGSSHGMMKYIDDMCYYLKSKNHNIQLPFDQGVHNYLGWKEHRGIYKVDLEDVIVNTIGLTPNNKISIRDGLVLVDQKFSPIIQQWDRHKSICDFVKNSDKFKLF